MPSVETTNLAQKAVLWSITGYDGNGDPEWSSPVEINVRWEQGNRGATTGEGTPISKGVTVDVDRDVAVDSRLWLGCLENLPANAADLWRVDSFDKIPDLKGRKYQRSVTLNRI